MMVRRLIGYRVRDISDKRRSIAFAIRKRGRIVSWHWVDACAPLPRKDARRLLEIVRARSEFRDGVRLFRVYRRKGASK